MRRYLLKRVLQNIVALWVVITIIFVLFRLLPGDPAAVLIDPLLPAELKMELRQRFGLDRSIPQQYFVYLKNLVQGDLGNSFTHQRPVQGVLKDKIVNTFILTLLTFLVAYSFGIAGGTFLAWKRGTRFEVIGNAVVLAFRSAPIFWTGIMAIMLFSFQLDLLPFSGMRSLGYSSSGLFEKYFSLDFVHHLILPVMMGSLYYCGLPLLLVRNTLLEIMGEDFIQMAKAKGMSEWQLMFKHALRNAVLPAVTASALFIGWAMGGQTLTEYVFSWPGLGREIVVAINNRDYPVAQGAFIFISVLIMSLNLIADLLYAYLDPRIRLS
jgi:peptide/nickel transport system permease protein